MALSQTEAKIGAARLYLDAAMTAFRCAEMLHAMDSKKTAGRYYKAARAHIKTAIEVLQS